jgi:hypothetical protein
MAEVTRKTLVTSATTASGVGTYGVTLGSLANANYAISYVGNTLSVTQRAITVTADAGSRIYGNANPALTYQVTSGDLVNGDGLTGVLATSATTASDVGAYSVTLGSLANGNYAISYVGNDLSVTQRTITVTADAKIRPKGMPNPQLTYKVGGMGLVNGDVFGGALTTDASSASEPGSYAIGQGSLAISANYDLAYVGADLVVLSTYAVPPTDGAASIVAQKVDVRGGGAPLPVFFTGFTANGDAQTLVEDPRLDQTALCHSMATVAAVCAVASAQ